MTNTKTYKCKENDNKIKVIFQDGEIDELHFSDCLGKEWTVIGIKDLKRALSLIPNFNSKKIK